jgi:hypothetical protein
LLVASPADRQSLRRRDTPLTPKGFAAFRYPVRRSIRRYLDITCERLLPERQKSAAAQPHPNFQTVSYSIWAPGR